MFRSYHPNLQYFHAAALSGTIAACTYPFLWRTMEMPMSQRRRAMYIPKKLPKLIDVPS